MTELSWWLLYIEWFTSYKEIAGCMSFLLGGITLISFTLYVMTVDVEIRLDKTMNKVSKVTGLISSVFFLFFLISYILVPTKNTMMTIVGIEVLDEVASQISEHTDLPEKSLKMLDNLADRFNQYLEVPEEE